MKGDAYDPPVELEGPDMGLVEQLAARLWYQRSTAFAGRNRGGRHQAFNEQSAAVRTAWRATAFDALQMLFDIGMVGPAGKPNAERFEGLTYNWMYSASEWEIIDAEGGYVALVRETPDLELMLCAPQMARAIRELGTELQGSPVLEHPNVNALFAALPENQDPHE